jgi:hypothetical protein
MQAMSWSAALVFAGSSLTVSSAVAAPSIPAVYQATAEAQGVPPSLFYAIAMQESGRFHEDDGRLKPWPWSLNVAGKAYYYDSMEEAWDALAGFVEEQPAHIGIGLVQITWPYNPHLLRDPYTALEPSINLGIGAQILRACYERLGDWWLAAGCYHSPTPAYATAYQERVQRHWLALMAGGRAGS